MAVQPAKGACSGLRVFSGFRVQGAHLADVHDVGVVEAEQDVDLADGSHGEALLLLVHLHLLQRDDAPGRLVARAAQAGFLLGFGTHDRGWCAHAQQVPVCLPQPHRCCVRDGCVPCSEQLAETMQHMKSAKIYRQVLECAGRSVLHKPAWLQERRLIKNPRYCCTVS